MFVATRTNVRNGAAKRLSVFLVVGLEKQAFQRRIDAGTFGPLRPFGQIAAKVLNEPIQDIIRCFIYSKLGWESDFFATESKRVRKAES